MINTGTTICTFLMVFLLQNTGNRTISDMNERLHSLEQNNLAILRELQTHSRASGDAEADLELRRSSGAAGAESTMPREMKLCG